MTCLEAQSNIMAFIERRLPDANAQDFVRHIKHCPNCAEELEIYYTLIVGMRQLDNDEELSHDFKHELTMELNRLDNKIKKAKRFKISTFGIVFAAMVVFFAFFYQTILDKTYVIQQNLIKERQGEMYFYDNFKNYLDICESPLLDRNETLEPVEAEKIIFYEQIRDYLLENASEENKADASLL